MKKTVKELVNFLENEKMVFAMKTENGRSPRKYLNKEEFFKTYGLWLDEIPVEWYPSNLVEDDGTWYCLFIIK